MLTCGRSWPTHALLCKQCSILGVAAASLQLPLQQVQSCESVSVSVSSVSVHTAFAAETNCQEQHSACMEQQRLALLLSTTALPLLLLLLTNTGLYPMPAGPYYSAAKAGVVNFVRSLAPRLAAQGIRIAAICPQA